MSYYQLADTQKVYKITLNLSVDDDFIPENINWSKLLELNDYEQVESICDTEMISGEKVWTMVYGLAEAKLEEFPIDYEDE